MTTVNYTSCPDSECNINVSHLEPFVIEGCFCCFVFFVRVCADEPRKVNDHLAQWGRLSSWRILTVFWPEEEYVPPDLLATHEWISLRLCGGKLSDAQLRSNPATTFGHRTDDNDCACPLSWFHSLYDSAWIDTPIFDTKNSFLRFKEDQFEFDFHLSRLTATQGWWGCTEYCI